MNTIASLYQAVLKRVSSVYERTHWFTDKEAWTLYRIFAFGEAVGWTLLISAIIYRKFNMPGDDIAISIAGTMHGLLFILYFVFVILTARSMMWGFCRISGALLAGILPYTSLIYEKFMAYDRKNRPVHVEPPADID